jgi:hypothetical protein
MFEPQPCSTPAQRRRAIILLVVLALLTLFAIVGLTFVMYADSEATSSRIFREANYRNSQNTGPTVTSDVLAAWALGQLVFDVDDNTGLYSAMRGHSVARDMYGYNYTWTPPGVTPINPAISMPPPNSPNSPNISNIFPFNGTGKLHVSIPSLAAIGLTDDAMVPNYTYYSADGFVRDPERFGTRTVNPVGTNPNTFQPGSYTGGWNSSYTYPDHNHMFLGAAKADGTLLTQSFYRSWTGFGSLDPTNPNWFDPTKPALKYMVLRPRPADQLLAGETWPPPRPFFPPPADAHGDVANITRPDGLSDSFWMDLNFPVQYTSTGQKYKPLFAFFVQDLDNRVNINAHGNIRGLGNGISPHMSNQGLGKWEVNLGQVLTQNQNPLAGTFEWTNLFLGNGTISARYGKDNQPNTSGTPAQPGSFSQSYAQLDVDACNELAMPTPNVPTNKIPLPMATPNAFPQFPQGYSNGSNTERVNHPLMFNLVEPQPVGQPNAIDHVFGVQNMKLLLYSGQTGSQALTSEPGQLCKTNFDPTQPVSARICNLVTTDSWDVDRPAVTPWIYDRVMTSKYALAGTSPADQLPPTGPAIPFPDPGANRPNPVPGNSEFGVPTQAGDWRAYNDSFALAASGRITQYLSRVDLNRFLRPYPHLGQGASPTGLDYVSFTSAAQQNATFQSTGRFDSDPGVLQQFQYAQQDRQELADDIYRRLVRVSGVVVPPDPTAATFDQQLAPCRWLAQLAVNIVDFIDEDEISTPFNFYTAQDATAGGYSQFATSSNNGELLKYWVFGIELPRVVLNEVLTEYTLPTMTGSFNVNFWVELYNPLPTTPSSPTNPLQSINTTVLLNQVAAAGGNPAFNPYQLLITDSLLAPSPGLNNNILGTPNVTRNKTDTPNDFPGTGNTVGTTDNSNPTVPASIAPQTYFLIGPPAGTDDVGKTISPTNSPTRKVPDKIPLYKSSGMQYTLWYDMPSNTFKFPDQNGTPAMDTTNGVTVMLRRLANPYMPYNAQTNPYITIDYLDKVILNKVVDATTVHNSRGKLQPYASFANQIADQKGDMTVNTRHSLGLQNASAGAPSPPDLPNYDWLVHLDRQVISPMELLNVSGFHPHQLTQQFRTNVATPDYGHLVGWWDQKSTAGQSNRLYRIFEFLESHDRASGMQVGGRLAGKININTIWDQETFNALCDAQLSNDFLGTDVSQVYQSMIALRTPNLGGAPPGISANDQPFLSLAIGNVQSGNAADPLFPKTATYAGGSGINNTFLASAPGGVGTQRLFVPTTQVNAHPYIQNELMTKIFNNVTTRSNVFAVWLTVGFFNVVQDTDAMGNPVLPVKLGAEMGAQYRKRMFAIIDRTNLNILAMTSQTEYLNSTTYVGPSTSLPALTTITLSGLSGPAANGMTWSIQPGMTLVVDTGSNRSYLSAGQAANQETVIVQSVNTATNQITAIFTRPHGAPGNAAKYNIMIPGNPGPQPNIGCVGSLYQPVIPYVALIN